ncbi:MAG TPA: 3-hydroxy-5-phosphonooxypentane-2,4-dione thiolase [bacterium]|nr:3-hydroxy-5-phosphonooxypentane-2,4-dione thiolase [bacterium]HPN94083.1 3-hydroxy-5-phosphonooxypentane-2,4-dione thiolase [bacterium]
MFKGGAPMDWGMKNRISKIIRPETGRAVMLAVDHGYFLGPTRDLEVLKKTISPLITYADSLMLTRGALRSSVDSQTTTPIVLRVSGGSSVIGESLANEGLITSMEDAIRLNAVAVAISIFVGTQYEKQNLLNMAELVNQGERVGVPVLAVTAVGKELGKRDQRFLSLSCRIAAELGARIVKTYYCDGFEKVASTCPVPCVIAGGPKLETELDAFEMTYNAIKKGAVGVDMGRNIWQNPKPVAMIKAIRAIVHENMKPQEALKLYECEKNLKKSAAKKK